MSARDAPLAIAAIVPTLNEERAIGQCLRPLIGRFEQVFVVDSGSADRTQAIASSLGATVVPYEWNGGYPKKKQWSLDNLPLESEWALFVDADEVVTPEMFDALDALDLSDSDMAAFDVPLEYWWRGKRLDFGQVVTKRALLRVDRCKFPVLDDLGAPGMGEQEGHYQPIADGLIGVLPSRLGHRDPDPLSDWFARHNRYSDWEAYLRADERLRKDVARYRSRNGRRLERLPFKPLAVFLYNYILKQGWRDGRHGFEYAAALAIYQMMISMKVRERLEGRSKVSRND